MIKIDWTAFIRYHIWFGWQCVGIFDGEGYWQRSFDWRNCIVPVCKRDWNIERWKLDIDSSATGCQVWVPDD